MADRSRIEALLSEGLSQAQVAKQLGISQPTVSRTLAEQSDGRREMQDAAEAFIASLGLDLAPDVLARVASLRTVARQIDWAAGAGTGTAAAAHSPLNKEFVSLVDELKQAASLDELREALLAADG